MRRTCPILSLPLALLGLLLASAAMAQRFADAAPRAIADIYPGDYSGVNGGNGESAANGEKYFFVADDGTAANDGRDNIQIWACDGATQALTQLTRSGSVKDHTDPVWIGPNGRLYFFYSDPEHGREIWSMDSATPGSERMLVDATPGAGDSGFYFLQTIGSNVIFALNNRITDKKILYLSDGTPEGTRLLQDQCRKWYQALEMSNGLFYFFYNPPNDSGVEIWRSDGTTSGTISLKNLKTEANLGFHETVGVGRTTYLLVRTHDGTFPPRQDQLWKTDGTAEKTVRINFSDNEFINSIHRLVSFQGRLYFIALSAAGDYRLYRYEEKPNAPAEAVEVARFPGVGLTDAFAHIEATDRQLILFTRYGVWRSDATAGGTTLLRSLNLAITVFGYVGSRPVLGQAYYPRVIKVPGQERWIFAAAESGYADHDLWWTNGSPGGVYRLADLEDCAEGYSPPSELAIFGQNLYFFNDDPEHGREPWLMPLTRLYAAARGWSAYR